MYPKLSLEKREVYSNQTNNAMFLALAKELWIPQSELGVPFVYNKETKTYTVGVQPAIDQFTASIQSDIASGTPTEDTPQENTESLDSTVEK